MEQSKGNAVVREIARPQHEGHVVAVLEINGREAWLASQVSGALGYERVDQVTKIIVDAIAEEAEEATDYQVIRGEELALLKQAAPDLVDARAPSVMVLYESGVFLVAMRARTEKARAFRRWLAEEVLPSIRRTGGYGRTSHGLTAEDVARIASAAAAATVDQVLSRLAQPAAMDLDTSTDVVRRAREMRHLALRHRRSGRALFAMRLEDQAASLLLGDASSEPELDDLATEALRHIMTAVNANPVRFYDQPRGQAEPAAGSWWGRRDTGGQTVALLAAWVDATLLAAGYDPHHVRRAWHSRLWLHTQAGSRGLTCNVRLGGRTARCIVFPVDILEHLGVL